jgi:hypothetical protein
MIEIRHFLGKDPTTNELLSQKTLLSAYGLTLSEHSKGIIFGVLTQQIRYETIKFNLSREETKCRFQE